MTRQKELDVAKARAEESKARIEMKKAEIELRGQKLVDKAARHQEKQREKEAKLQLLASCRSDTFNNYLHMCPANPTPMSFPQHLAFQTPDRSRFSQSSSSYYHTVYLITTIHLLSPCIPPPLASHSFLSAIWFFIIVFVSNKIV